MGVVQKCEGDWVGVDGGEFGGVGELYGGEGECYMVIVVFINGFEDLNLIKGDG